MKFAPSLETRGCHFSGRFPWRDWQSGWNDLVGRYVETVQQSGACPCDYDGAQGSRFVCLNWDEWSALNCVQTDEALPRLRSEV